MRTCLASRSVGTATRDKRSIYVSRKGVLMVMHWNERSAQAIMKTAGKIPIQKPQLHNKNKIIT